MIIQGRRIIVVTSSATTNGQFSFTLNTGSTTSAGVFTLDGKLVKTLWNGVYYSAGTFTEYWDSLDDYGQPILTPNTSYQIKVLSNNVNYEWQGTIGNTSDNLTGVTKHRTYSNCMRGLAFGLTYGYMARGYSEGAPSINKFNISTPQQKIEIFPDKTSNANTDFVCTDDNIVYWGGYDAFSTNNTFVYGTLVSSDLDVAFSSGTNFNCTNGRTYSTISRLNVSNSYITGLAVQKTGNYLFVARSGLNQLQVIDKVTGLLVQTLTYTSPRGLSIDADDNLWMCTSDSTVAKYTVNSGGTLTSPILSLIGLIYPTSTQVSTTSNTVAICDSSTSQQVKFYNSNTGTLLSTLGTAGGYSTDATVNDNKFYFKDVNGELITFISYQPDGSFWVNDPGNTRVQHYNSSNSFINRIMAMGPSYSTYVDKNNINKVFNGSLEFAIDYSVQNPTGTSGWMLVKNWGYPLVINADNLFGLGYHITLVNGRTYALNRETGGTRQVVELTSGNTLRFTGIYISSTAILCDDGSVQDFLDTTGTFRRFPLTGFDGLGNPLWSGTPEILATNLNNVDVITYPLQQTFNNETSNIVSFQPSTFKDGISILNDGFHLGIISRGADGVVKIKTEKSTHRNYSGPYPKIGWFEIGNNVNNFAGSGFNYIGRNILTSYHGEFWKAMQTNQHNHYYDNGLAIGQFGTNRDITGLLTHSAAKMAGNALTPTLVKNPLDQYSLYLWHGDESDHSGIHRWKISGLNTISEQVATINYPTTYATPTLNYIDLMSGLPWNSTLINNTSGWTRNPIVDDTVSPSWIKFWKVFMSKQSYDVLKDNDISVGGLLDVAGQSTVTRDLGTNNVTTNWKISGNISYPDTGVNRNDGSNNSLYLEILDVNSKVLIHYEIYGQYGGNTQIKANGINLADYDDRVIFNVIKQLQPYSIQISGGSVTFIHANYPPVVTTISDGTGDWTKPKTLRIRLSNAGSGGYGKDITLQNLKLYKDY